MLYLISRFLGASTASQIDVELPNQLEHLQQQ